MKGVGQGRTGSDMRNDRLGAKGRRSGGQSLRVRAVAMVLIAEAQQLKAKLMLKGKYRPEKMVRAKMPDGSGMLTTVPQRRQGHGVDSAEAENS